MTHVCSPCGQSFGTEEEYLAHTCTKSGKNPTEMEHLEKTTTPLAGKIAEKALERGAERKAE